MSERFTKFGKKAAYSETSSSEAESRNIFIGLLDQRFVKGTPNIFDKLPNFDGMVDITDEENRPVGPIYVQLKTLQPRDYKQPKHQCEASFLSACADSGIPVLLIGVNQAERIAFWLHMDEDVLLDAENRLKGKSVSVSMPLGNILSDRTNLDYVKAWTAIAQTMKRKVHGFDELERKNDRLASDNTRLEKKVQEHEKWALISENTKRQYITAELESLHKLRMEGHHDAVLKILNDDTDVRWKDLTAEQIYRRTVAKALTYLDLNDFTDAAPLLISLVNHDHQQKDTFSLAAVGYLINDDRRQAESYAQKAIAADPNDPNGYAVLIKLSGKTAGKKPIKIPVMPPAVAENIIIKVAEAKSLEDHDQPEAACAVYEKLSLTDLGDEVLAYDIRSYHGIALAESLSYPELMVNGGGFPEDVVKAKRARELLAGAIDYFKQTDLLASRYYLFINRGVLNKLLGEPEASIADFRRAYEINKSYITLRYLMINGPAEQWATLVADVSELDLNPDEKIEFAQLAAEQFLMAGRPADALKSLEPFTQKKAIKGKYSFGYILLADTYSALGRNDEIDMLVNRLEQIQPTFFVHYFLAFQQQIPVEPAKDLSQLKQNLLAETEKLDFVWVRTMTFDLFYRNKDFDLAAAVYEPLCSKSSFNDITKSFLQALFSRGWYVKTESWIKAYIGTQWETAFLVDMLSTIYDRSKSRSKAIAVISDYLGRKESELLRIKMALLYTQTGDLVRAKAQLVKITSLVPDSPEHAFYLAQAYMKVGMDRQGLEIAYTQLRDGFQLFYQHQNYQQFIQTSALGSRHYRDEGKIGLNSYVELERDGETKDFILVGIPKYEKEVGLTSLDVNDLFGKTVGEVVPFGEQQWRVKRTVSKYAWLFLRSVSFTTGRTGEQGEPPVEEVRQALIARELLVIDDIRTAVRSHQFMEVLAIYLQMNLVDFWRKMTVRYDVPIVAVASDAENEAITGPIPPGGLLFDISTLINLREAELWSIIDALPNPKYVVFSTMRVLDECISYLQLAIVNGDQKVYRLVNGELAEEVMTAEKWLAEEERVGDLRKQIVDRCELIEGEVPEDYLLYLRNVGGVGRCNFDNLLAAERKGLAIVTDDAFFRVKVNQQYNIPMITLTHLLFHLVAQHRFSAVDRNDAMIRLLDRNFYNFPISPSFLMYIYRREQNIVGPKLQRALQFFKSGPIGNVISLIMDLFRLMLATDQSLENKRKSAFDLFHLFFSFDHTLTSKTLFSNRIDLDPHILQEFKDLLNEELDRAYLKN